MRAALAALLLALTAAHPGHADEALSDPLDEARARALMRELGCPVCEGQSIADSDAPVAADMRRLVRTGVAERRSDEQVLAELASMYGESVRLRPRAAGAGQILWFAPIAILAIALGAAAAVARSAARSRENTD